MFRIFPVKEISGRKKMLVAQSDIHRHTMLLQVALAEQSVIRLKKRFTTLGISSVALSAGASIAGLLFAKRQPSEKSGGFLSKIFSGLSLFNQVKSIFSRLSSSAQDAPDL